MPVSKNKMPVSKSKLFKRYFLIIVSIIVACLFVLGTSLVLLISNYWWTEQVEILKKNSKSISTTISELEVFDGDTAESYEEAADMLYLISEATSSDYFVCNEKGEIIVCKESSKQGDYSSCDEHSSLVIPESYIENAMHSGFTDYTRLGKTFINNNFVVAVPIVVGEETVGAVFAVKDAVSSLLPYVESTIKMFAISVLASLIIAFIASYVFSYGIAKPLSEMTEGTRHFAKGNFAYRVNEKHKKGEMHELAVALNKMADDLDVDEKAKQSFIANVSHELKTPMTTIGGFIDGILDGTIPQEKADSYLNTVSTEVKRLARLVVAMLNLSKIESGETQLKPITYDVSSQIFETLLSFERKIDDNKISVEGFEGMDGVTVCADKDLLHQVIYNLLDNAVKFTPVGGVISLYANNDGVNTTVRIRNSGEGVKQEEISRIFERFYKVDKSRSYDTKGVGLGLYIVKTIIHMHSGEIHADSKPGEYTEFVFSIPVNHSGE